MSIFKDNSKRDQYIIEQYNNGLTVQEITDTIDVCNVVVYNTLRNFKIKLRKKELLNESYYQSVVDDYLHSDLDTNDISKKYNINIAKLYIILKKLNIIKNRNEKETLKKIGRKMSLKQKKKLSKIAKKRFEDPRNHPLYGKPCSEERKRKISAGNLGRKLSNEVNAERLKKQTLTKTKNGTLGKGGQCAWYLYDGMKFQGRYELFYYLKYKNAKLIKNLKPIQTPYGYYYPDFKNGKNKYVEIKSTYTLKLMNEGKQGKKIDWINNNTKNSIKIFVFQDNDIKKELNRLGFNKKKLNEITIRSEKNK